jgi:hypothetical protein
MIYMYGSIQPVYAFVRTTLDLGSSSKPFMLCTSTSHVLSPRPIPTSPFHFHVPLPRQSSESQLIQAGQPPKTQYPEHPPPNLKKPNPHKTPIIAPAQYGAVRGSLAQGLQNGSGGDETLADLGLVPQSVLMIRWEDESMNGKSNRKLERLDKH